MPGNRPAPRAAGGPPSAPRPGRPAEPLAAATGPAAFQALCSPGRGVPRPATQPVRSWDARPLSGCLILPGTMWSGRQSRPRRRRGKSRRTAPSGFARRSKVRPGVSQWIPPPSDLLDAPSGRLDTRGCRDPFVQLGAGVEQEMCKDGNGVPRSRHVRA